MKFQVKKVRMIQSKDSNKRLSDCTQLLLSAYHRKIGKDKECQKLSALIQS